MSRNRDKFDTNRPSSRQREAIIDRRLRKFQGEDVDDALDDEYGDDIDDEYEAPRSLERPMVAPDYGRREGGSGCAQATLYLVLGALAALVVLLLFFRGTINSVGSFFSSSAPNIAEMVASPTPTLNLTAAAVVQRVQQLNRLETTSYTVEKVIEAGIQGNTFEDILFGDRLLLIAHGTVEAGLDLRNLTEDDIIVSADGSAVTVRLPPVEIFSASLDNSRTRVYDRQQGLLAPSNRDLETQARQAAEDEILRGACEGGVLENAQADSERAIEQLLSLLEFDQVVVESAPVPNCPSSLAPDPTPTS